jgi:hypothetical protein
MLNQTELAKLTQAIHRERLKEAEPYHLFQVTIGPEDKFSFRPALLLKLVTLLLKLVY